MALASRRRPVGAHTARRAGAGGRERIRHAGCRPGRPPCRPPAAIDDLTAAAGQRYGPDVVHALAAVVGVKRRTSRSRRTADEGAGVRGAAWRPVRRYDRASLCRATSPPPRARHLPPGRRDLLVVAAHGCAPPPAPRPSASAASPSGRWPAHRPRPARLRLRSPRPATQPRRTGAGRPDPPRLRGVDLQVLPTSEFAITPGDFASAYGDLGLRFKSLQVAFAIDPRLSLYAPGWISRYRPLVSWSRISRPPAAMSGIARGYPAAMALPAHRRTRDLGAARGQRHGRRHAHLYLGGGRLCLPADRC